MEDHLKDKLQKIYELIQRGATEGEKEAAKKALDRIVKKYNLDESQLSSVFFKQYTFRYSSNIEQALFIYIVNYLHPHAFKSLFRYFGEKRIYASLIYTEYINIDCAYEYFRRHMKANYKKVVTPMLKKIRKNRAKKKAELDNLFIEQYLLKSNLVPKDDIGTLDASEMSEAEIKRRMKMLEIEGGNYNKQVENNLLLTR
jgi:hypothetical protein